MRSAAFLSAVRKELSPVKPVSAFSQYISMKTSNVKLYSYCFNQAGFKGNAYLSSVGWYSFKACSIGGNLIITDEVREITHTFRETSVGGFIYIGKNVVSIDNQSFYGTRCDKYYIAASTPPICKGDTAINLWGYYLGVPKGKKSAYENAEFWKNAAIIEEVDFSKLKIKP